MTTQSRRMPGRAGILLIAIGAYLVFGLITGSIGWRDLVTALLFFVVLGSLVIIHELGHFIVARLVGVRVLEFGIGFPPRARVLRSRGETLYSLNWIPIGGFVKLEGEDGDAADDPRAFSAKGLPTRIVILVAGVAMNVVLALALFVGTALVGDPAVGFTVPYVDPGSPADKAGLVVGDLIERVDGRVFGTYPEAPTLLDDLRSKPGERVVLTIRHADGTLEERVATLRTADEIKTGKGALGIGRAGAPVEGRRLDVLATYTPGEAVALGVDRTVWATRLIIDGVGALISNFVSHPTEAPQASGPLGIAQTIGDVFWAGGLLPTVFLAAVISANLAVMNILPFPPLDGGRVLMLVLKAVLGKRISLRAERLTYMVGFAVLFAFIIWVTAFDIIRGFSG